MLLFISWRPGDERRRVMIVSVSWLWLWWLCRPNSLIKPRKGHGCEKWAWWWQAALLGSFDSGLESSQNPPVCALGPGLGTVPSPFCQLSELACGHLVPGKTPSITWGSPSEDIVQSEPRSKLDNFFSFSFRKLNSCEKKKTDLAHTSISDITRC